jgi:hypothetical protein
VGARRRRHTPDLAFDAAYTLADLGEGLRITAIAHNETSQLRTRMVNSGRD